MRSAAVSNHWTGTRSHAYQLQRLNQLLAEVVPANPFYAAKFSGIELPLRSLSDLATLPLTTKEELVAAAEGQLPPNLTYPRQHYKRFHQTSGTHGKPLSIYDTRADWQWWIETWQFVLDAADVTADDRALMAFSFGPFVGFWSAYDALAYRDVLVIPTGGLSTIARLELVRTTQATVLCCTPTYAQRMAEVALAHDFDLRDTPIRVLIVAGEPGGSLLPVRTRIEQAWGAAVIDHSGATEVGPWGYADRQRQGLHVVESEFIAEFMQHASQTDTADELQELILTALGRRGQPVIRYRTGDLVHPTDAPAGENQFVLLQGGVRGRADDMLVIRGVNVFPTAVEQVIRSFPEVAEFRLTAYKEGAMDALRVDVESAAGQTDRIAAALRTQLGLRIEVRWVEPGLLPRFEAKAKRVVDER